MSTLTKNLVVAADGGNYECRPSNGGAGTGFMTSVIVVTGLLLFWFFLTMFNLSIMRPKFKRKLSQFTDDLDSSLQA